MRPETDLEVRYRKRASHHWRDRLLRLLQPPVSLSSLDKTRSPAERTTPRRGRRRALAAALAFSFLVLGLGIEKAGIAGAFSDPVGQIRAQDESFYANSAVGLAEKGGWLTPKVLGRYLLYKPPLLVWLAGGSLKVFGKSLFALRLPALVAAVLGTVCIFSWIFGGGTMTAASASILLPLSSPLWHTFARLCYTDMLLAACTVGAMLCLYMDPQLKSRSSLIWFAILTAAGIMAKNVAGLLPFLVLLLYTGLLRGPKRPSLERIGKLILLITLLSAPWPVYQFVIHRQWFWADYVQVQILGFGLRPPAQYSAEGPVLFYVKRLALIEPFLLLFVLIALPTLFTAIRRRDSVEPILIASWITVATAALLAFQYRNLPYALHLIAPLSLIAIRYGPLFTPKRARLGLGILCGVFLVKASFGNQLWGLPFGVAQQLQAAAAIRSYYDRARSNELILVSPDDAFYSSTLPLPRVRYCFIDPADVVRAYSPHYEYLGITMTVDQFCHIESLRDVFAARLRDWGLDSTEPLATAIVAQAPADVLKLIRTHPQSDFYLPAEFRSSLDGSAIASREIVPAADGRFFLLASNPRGEMRRVTKPRLPRLW